MLVLLLIPVMVLYFIVFFLVSRRNKSFSCSFWESNKQRRLYCVKYGDDLISTTVTTSPDGVYEWVDQILRRNTSVIVGFDIEPHIHHPEKPPIALIQLSVSTHTLIYQLHQVTVIPDPLIMFFRDERVRFVGINIAEKVSKLQLQCRFQLVPRAMVELRPIAASRLGQIYLINSGLTTMAAEVIRTYYVKPRRIRRSNWRASILSNDQVMYATLDSFITWDIAATLRA